MTEPTSGKAPVLAVTFCFRPRLFLCAQPMVTTFLYRCPNTRQTVQGWAADEVTDDDEYQSIACLACAQVHLINPKTGKVLGVKED